MLRPIRTIAAALLFMLATMAFTQENPQPENKPEQYSATAFITGGPANGKSFGVNIYINSYTTDEEVKDFIHVLKTDGPDGLEKAFDKAPERGRIAPTGSTGNNLSVVRSHNAETKRILRMATNRIVSFPELRDNGRSRDYKFSIIELRLDADGNGEGTLMYATKVKFNKKGELELEHYGQKPIRLANVRKEK